MTAPNATPNPAHIFQALNAYQVSMALRGAIELELFTHIADGAHTAAEIATRAKASEKGVRVVCDFLTVTGFLSKSGTTYDLTPDSAMFLSKHSPAYLGQGAYFLLHDDILKTASDVGGVIRKGGTLHGEGTMEAENPVWVEFARSMGPISAFAASTLAEAVAAPGKPQKVLDIAAGPGMYGIAVAQRNPQAQIYAQDWNNVLQVTLEHARKYGVADRFHTIAGSAFTADLGHDYDVVLLPNFLHHFDHATNVTLLKRLRAAMKTGGVLATVEFVPNDDRISPPAAATFSFQMLTNTEHGDAYTLGELDRMFRDAGFGASTAREAGPETLLVTSYE
jgi:SAM-dependent methyltransferase